jgi:ethanolamine utilization protein EutA
MILSRLRIENRASAFSVPELQIASREILYKSPIHFTPLLQGNLVDGEGIRALVEAEYHHAGITRAQVDTGAIIITGETSRKENAATVLATLSDLAGDFVVATAGPDLESVLAAKGAGAVEYARNVPGQILHMDIGGGTSNLALIEDGQILATDCLNVGGRLLKFDSTGAISYISPVLEGIFDSGMGLETLADILVSGLEMAAGLQDPTDLLKKLRSVECGDRPPLPIRGPLTLSFSGGVADCIEGEYPDFAFGDFGPILGRAIRRSRLCRGPYRLGSETIRATVIGAGCHSAQLSGSTVYHQNIRFPMKNLPVVTEITDLSRLDGPGVLALAEVKGQGYEAVRHLAEEIASAWHQGPVMIALRQDLAKALGHALALRLGKERPILCIDRVALTAESYLDIATPTGPALPLIVKTLILNR